MKNLSLLIIIITLIFIPTQSLHADCRGCCAGHGGIICVNGVTKCRDGSLLSQKCIDKGCDVCPEQESTTTLTTIRIASFNIQVFGRAKASKDEVMEILANTISQFDIVAIQEIRDKSGTAIKALEVAVDDIGVNYDFVIGPRLGRTTSKEQYAYFYKTDVIEVEGSYTYDDSGNDTFHRELYIAKFKVKNGNLDFAMINIHVDPGEATSEINALPSVISNAQSHFTESDVILLGDLNADCNYFDEDNTTSPLKIALIHG